MRELYAYVNGQIVPARDAKISIWDSGFQHGDSVYEGIRVYNGRLLSLDEHLARLHASAHAIGIRPALTQKETAAAIMATLRANEFVDNTHIRITLTRGVKVMTGMDPRLMGESGPGLVIIAEAKDPVFRQDGIRLITSSIRRMAADMLDPKIHSSNQLGQILAKLEANNAGADEALMLDREGFVAETNSANFFIVRGQEILTPRGQACLNGLTRAWVLGHAPAVGSTAREENLSLTDVYTADEAFLSGTVCELVPVAELDGRTIGSGQPGPLTRRLLEDYHHYARTHGVEIT